MRRKKFLATLLAASMLLGVAPSLSVHAELSQAGDTAQADTTVKLEKQVENAPIVVSIPAEVTLTTLNAEDFESDTENKWKTHFKGNSDINFSNFNYPSQLVEAGACTESYPSYGIEDEHFFEKYYDCIDTISVSSLSSDGSKSLRVGLNATVFTLTGANNTLTAYAEFPDIYADNINGGYIESASNCGIKEGCWFNGTTTALKVPITFFYYGDVEPDTYTGTVTFTMEVYDN